ncbi:MAG: cellulase family glycosylhydrolase [Candidatus Binataceae bacterium]
MTTDRNEFNRGMKRPRRFFAFILSVAAVLALASASASAAESYGPLSHAGRWITDSQGRVIIIHGVNVPAKLPPAYPSAIGFNNDDGAFLAKLGFDGARVTVERYAVEPSPGHFDPAYIDRIAGTVRMLARHGILSLIDFHQDEYGPYFHDNGYPEWMTVTDGLPNDWTVGFPYQYLDNPANMRAFDHLWANDPGPDGKPLQDDDAAILAYAAKRLRNVPGVMGYEIINEPWPGSQWPSCIVAQGCPTLDASLLGAYYERMIPALRAADPNHMIWYEPFSTFNYGAETHVPLPSADPKIGFAFHDYNLCSEVGPMCNPVESDTTIISNALTYVAANGDALLETEFSGTSDTMEEVQLYDQYMIPWLVWSYPTAIVKFVGTTPISYDKTGPGSGPSDSPDGKVPPPGHLLPPRGGNVDWNNVDILTRAYPRRTSGTPLSWYYDGPSRTFTMQYSTARVDGTGSFPAGAVTEIVTPRRNYPRGYGVTVTGGRIVSAPGAAVLQVAACGSASEVSLTVSPEHGIRGSCQ